MELNIPNKIVGLTSKKKKEIYSKIKDIKSSIFNELYLKEILPLIDRLDEININKLLNIKNKKYIQCKFMYNHFCWTSIYEGKQRYFSKRYLTYSLDIIDLLSIYFNCSYNQLYNYLIDWGYKGNDYKKFEKEKHLKNIDVFEKIINSNDLLLKHLSGKRDIYIALNHFAANNTLSFQKYEENSIFFISSSFLKKEYNLPYSLSTISQSINFYCLIGLIKKVPQEYLKNPYYLKYKSEIKKKNIVTFYIIPFIEDIYSNIIKNLKVIDKMNLKYYQLNKSIIENLNTNYDFQVNMNHTIGGGHFSKKSTDSYLNKDVIGYLFHYYLDEKGVVAKEWILRDLESSNRKVSMTTFDKKWNELIGKFRGNAVKPTKKMKERFSLKTNKEIFILKTN